MVGSPTAVIESPPTSDDERPTAPASVSIPTVDLTGVGVGNRPHAGEWQAPPFTSSPFAAMARSGRTYNSAVRRMYTRRERFYDRAQPDVVRERLDVAEEAEAAPAPVARQRALSHLSRAYAVAGYAQAALCVAVCSLLTYCVLSFGRGLVGDVARKGRERTLHVVRSAANCRMNYAENQCATAAATATAAVRALCDEWRHCVTLEETAKIDANSATLWAEAVAETFNAFAEKVSSTTLLVVLLFAAALLFLLSTVAHASMHRKLVDERLNAPLASPPPPSPSSYAALTDKPYASPHALRPRSISFEPDADCSPSTKALVNTR